MNQGRLQPAVIGGAIFGVASAIPILSCVNCACCALAIGGGMIAAWLHLKNLGPVDPAPYGEGALVGALAGVVGAVVAVGVSIPFRLMSSMWQPDMSQLNQALTEMPPEARQFVEPFMNSMFSGGMGIGALFFQLFVGLILYSIFAALGGVLGVAIFHRKY